MELNNQANKSNLNSSNNIDSFLLKQVEVEKQKVLEKERIEQEIKDDLKKIKVTLPNFHKAMRSRSLEQKQENQILISQIIITKQMVNSQNYPISPNFKKEIQELFDLDILKPFEISTLKEKFYEILTQEKIIDLCKFLFWLIFARKFPLQVRGPQTLTELKDQISYKFTKIFSTLPKPKDEILNYTLFCLSYVIHKVLFEFFKADRQIFNLRFVLDCYHLVIEEINGINVTDYFLQVNIDRIFSFKFLEYEKTKSAIHKTRKMVIQKDRNYFGQTLEPSKPQTEEQFQFLNQIKDTLKNKTKLLKPELKGTNYSPQMKNRFKKMHLGFKKSSSKGSRTNSKNSIGSDKDKDLSDPNSPNNLNRLSKMNDKKRNPWQNQSFIFLNQGRSHKLIDRNTYQKIKRNKKVELENIQETFINDQGDELFNIAPSLRVKASGRDITYQRLRFNLNGISPTIKTELGLTEKNLPDTQQKVIFHPIDRVIKMNNLNQKLEKSKIKMNQQIKEIDEYSYDEIQPLITGNFIIQMEQERLREQNAKQEENQQQHQLPQKIQTDLKLQNEKQDIQDANKQSKKSKIMDLTQNKIQKSQQPKSILAQYDLSHGQFGKNEISKNPLIYKDMLEMKMVLNVYREKTTNWPSSKRLQQRKFQGIKDDIMERTDELDKLVTRNDNFNQNIYNQTDINNGNMVDKFKIDTANQKIQSKSLSPKKWDQANVYNFNQNINSAYTNKQGDSQLNSDINKKTLNTVLIKSNKFYKSNSLDKSASEQQQNNKIDYEVEEREKLIIKEKHSKLDAKKDLNDYLYKDRNKEYIYDSKINEYNQKYANLNQYSSKNQNNFQQKKLTTDEIKFKLIKQKTALSKKGAGWNMYQHLIDFRD